MRNAVLGLFCLISFACGPVKGQLQPDAEVDASTDPCETNTCECTVATQATDCPGLHKICDEVTTPGRVCGCAPAYRDDGAGNCIFDAAPLDPGFQDTTVWQPVGEGVTLNVAAAGSVDPGEGIFNRVGICEFGGFTQTFTMPPLELAEQFKLTVTHTSNDPSFFDLPDGTAIVVGVNGDFQSSIFVRNDAKTESFCLGPRAYGQGPVGSPVQFYVGVDAGQAGFLCGGTSPATISIDNVKLEVAAPGECPSPGTVVNGDFEVATDWTFAPIVQGATGAIVTGVGENGTRGARLTTVNKCSEVTMRGTIALPDSAVVPNPAIDFFFSGTLGARLVMQLNGKNTATFAGANATHRRVCVPAWARGTTTSVGFFLQRSSNNGCATALARTFVIDNLTVVDDPACADVGDLLDGGFELVTTTPGVNGWGLTSGFVNDDEGSEAAVVTQNVNSGTRSLRLIGSAECVGVAEGGADFTINVPAPQGAAGPAIKFAANVGNGNLKTVTRVAVEPGPSATGAGLKFDIPEVGVYQPHVFCLPPRAAGRRMTFRFSTGDIDGGGCSTYPDELAFIDDVEVTTDASCPAE